MVSLGRGQHATHTLLPLLAVGVQAMGIHLLATVLPSVDPTLRRSPLNRRKHPKSLTVQCKAYAFQPLDLTILTEQI